MHFSKLWNCKIPHRLHMIHPALFFSCLPEFVLSNLLRQAAVHTDSCNRPFTAAERQLKKSSQCCVSVDPVVAISTYNPLSHASPLFYVHTHAPALSQAYYAHMFINSPVKSARDWWWWDGMDIRSEDKSPKLQWHGTVGFGALLRPEPRGAM